MLKKNLLLFFSFISLGSAIAQVKTPTQWFFNAKKINDKQYLVSLKVVLQKNWHIYSQNAGKGPASTQIVFYPNPLISTQPQTSEKGQLQKKYDPNFKSNIAYFADQVSFTNTISLKTKVKTQLKGHVYYMVCDDTKCLPPTKQEFTISLF